MEDHKGEEGRYPLGLLRSQDRHQHVGRGLAEVVRACPLQLREQAGQ